jgi:hypothetical protein
MTIDRLFALLIGAVQETILAGPNDKYNISQ